MLKAAPNVTYLKDYKQPDYWIESVELHIDLAEENTLVTAWLEITANLQTNSRRGAPLRLDGCDLQLKSIALNGEELRQADFKLTEQQLILPKVPEQCLLEVQTIIQPQLNTSLTGLYKSNAMFCTQCEAEGFRKITYFIDRPDVLSRYTVTISADKSRYPILLSNGNLMDQGELADNRHWVKWQDPFRKPCYLFALVAGDLACVTDQFTTQSGRQIELKIFVEKGNEEKCEHALLSLKNAMRWDEKIYGLEYDLDIYMIVAVNDFNMGAMENKGLNIFNAQYVLADRKTATDHDYLAIESVIAHEYFHNWSGNRVTCRDWFQLSLKEGLTIFRDEEFSADMTSRAVARIETVKGLRCHQFLEDAGPMAHPVRPDSYMEINNFYTSTVYQKGAEVIRMIRTLLSEEVFYRAMAVYFKRFDGQAVTIDDFVHVMEEMSGVDLSQFTLWYSQAGTPLLRLRSSYDQQKQTWTLAVQQSCPMTPGQTVKKPMHIPVTLGLLDSHGNEIPLQLRGETQSEPVTQYVLSVTKAEESFCFINVPEKPVPSLLRHFSAPVTLHTDLTDDALLFLLSRDKDGFNRWEAAQQLLVKILLKLIRDYQQGSPLKIDLSLIEAFRHLLRDTTLDPALLAQLLILPDRSYLGELQETFDVIATYEVHRFVRCELAKQLHDLFFERYQENSRLPSEHINYQIMASRSLKNVCLDYLMLLNDTTIRDLCLYQFHHADNMTDAVTALSHLADIDSPERDHALAMFYEKWHHDSLVINKWFAIQACSELSDTLARVKLLTHHPDFNLKNPNKVRALIGSFSRHNLIRFHDATGEGYCFLTEYILKLNKTNPQIAARLVEPLIHWKRFDAHRQNLMREQLQYILYQSDLSKDVYEIVEKGLAYE